MTLRTGTVALLQSAPNIHFFHSRKLGNLDFTTQVDLISESGYRKEEFTRRMRALVMTKYHIPVNNDNIKDFYIGANVQASIDSSATILGWQSYPQSALIAGDGLDLVPNAVSLRH